MDTIVGLELGADDYITKPFNLDILTAPRTGHPCARLSGAAALSPPEPLVIGDLFIDPAAHVVTVGGRRST